MARGCRDAGEQGAHTKRTWNYWQWGWQRGWQRAGPCVVPRGGEKEGTCAASPVVLPGGSVGAGSGCSEALCAGAQRHPVTGTNARLQGAVLWWARCGASWPLGPCGWGAVGGQGGCAASRRWRRHWRTWGDSMGKEGGGERGGRAWPIWARCSDVLRGPLQHVAVGLSSSHCGGSTNHLSPGCLVCSIVRPPTYPPSPLCPWPCITPPLPPPPQAQGALPARRRPRRPRRPHARAGAADAPLRPRARPPHRPPHGVPGGRRLPRGPVRRASCQPRRAGGHTRASAAPP